MKYLYLILIPLFLVADETKITRTQVHMGTFVSVTLAQKHHEKLQEIFTLISDIEDSLSSYQPTALLYRLNKHKTITYDAILADTIRKSISYHDSTDGYFDITIGAISKKLYKFGESVSSPTREALQKAILDVGKIIITNKTISLDPDITLDLGGIGKGYAVDKVANYLQESNITQGTIALSGDIRCVDRCETWIQSPFDEVQHFAKIMTKHPHTAISTSGTYRRYASTKSEHHLIDPKLKKPQQNFVSLSLFSLRNNTKLDAFATAVSVMPRSKALDFLKKHKDISFILVDNKGEILFNDNAKLLTIQWLPLSKRTSIMPNATKSAIDKKTTTGLIHPNISNPMEIKR